uniref:C2 calcium dependent domain containing 6 n=1 Tax=Cricetulus griseus TaxID=10029 RepID=A0A8C2MFK8_CRIGR
MELPPPGNRRVSISNPQETPQKFSISSGMVRHRPSMVSAGTSRLSTLRPQSLQPNPILQRRSLSPSDAPMMRRGSNVSSVRYADEEGQTRSATEKDKEDKEKSKSTGTRLLNMLRKTLKGSQSEEMIVAQETPNLIPFGEVVGCLAVHIKSCRQFSHRFIVQQHVNLFIRISINHVVKYTKLRNLKSINNERNLVLRFDEVKYFSVQVPRRQDDERNNIFLELMQDGGDTGKPALSLGSVESHLYEVIQKGCFTEALQMKHRNSAICRLEVEFMFSYGAFGYGFSHQLKPLQKIIEPSMFMKIAPPPDRTDPATNVITPQQVEYPAFLSPDLNVSIGAPETSTNVVRLTKLHEKPRERLEKMKTEYRHLDTWIEKAEYLRNLITPKNTAFHSVPSSSSSESLPTLCCTLPDPHPSLKGVDINGDKESLVIPVLKVLDQDLSDPALYESAESIPEETLLPPIHTLLIKEDEAPPRLHVPLGREDRSIAFAPGEALIHKRPSIVRIVSSPQEVKSRCLPINPESLRRRNLCFSPKE